jgi:acetyl esterase/lipase
VRRAATPFSETMPFNTITVSGAVAPTVIETYISHVCPYLLFPVAASTANPPQQYLNRKDLHHKPTAHVSYHEGLLLIRSFLAYASHHTVEELQAFTSQWVPTPQWVRTEDAVIPQKQITLAAEALQRQLGPRGIERVGGKQWWQWRRHGSILKGEWIEMRNDYIQRMKFGDPGKRVMMYVHGGAYFFGSVDEHRYQMQRHARKLKARVFAR